MEERDDEIKKGTEPNTEIEIFDASRENAVDQILRHVREGDNVLYVVCCYDITTGERYGRAAWEHS